MECSLLNPPGGTECGQFAITVPGRHVRGKTEGVEQPESTQTYRADGGLGHMSGAELFLQPLFPLGRKRRGRVNPVREA